MTVYSYLVALSGTQHSLFALKLAARLAKASGASLSAEHVLDSDCIWQLFGYDTPGLIGSQPFIEAHGAVRESMLAIGERLAEKYYEFLSAQGLYGSCFVDEGNPADEICLRAHDYDLVVIGHRPSSHEPFDERTKRLKRISVAQEVVNRCNKPVLLVQDELTSWKKVRVLTNQTLFRANYLAGALAFASSLKAEAELIFLSLDATNHLSTDEELGAIDTRNVKSIKEVVHGIFQDDFCLPSSKHWRDSLETLIIVPTIENNGVRKTIVGSTVESLVQHLTLPLVLFWPIEHRGAWQKDNCAETAIEFMQTSV